MRSMYWNVHGRLRFDQGGQRCDRQGARARLSRRARGAACGVDGRAVPDDGHVRGGDGVDQAGCVLHLTRRCTAALIRARRIVRQ